MFLCCFKARIFWRWHWFYSNKKRRKCTPYCWKLLLLYLQYRRTVLVSVDLWIGKPPARNTDITESRLMQSKCCVLGGGGGSVSPRIHKSIAQIVHQESTMAEEEIHLLTGWQKRKRLRQSHLNHRACEAASTLSVSVFYFCSPPVFFLISFHSRACSLWYRLWFTQEKTLSKCPR